MGPVNPLASRTVALLWVGLLKLLDVASTLIAYHTVPGFQEVNVLITTLQQYVGFDAAVLVTASLALVVVQQLHDRHPVVSEVVIVLLSVAVVGNTLLVLGYPGVWFVFMAAVTVGVLGYVAVGAYRHHRQADSWRERLFGVPDPVLWTPADRTT